MWLDLFDDDLVHWHFARLFDLFQPLLYSHQPLLKLVCLLLQLGLFGLEHAAQLIGRQFFIQQPRDLLQRKAQVLGPGCD